MRPYHNLHISISYRVQNPSDISSVVVLKMLNGIEYFPGKKQLVDGEKSDLVWAGMVTIRLDRSAPTSQKNMRSKDMDGRMDYALVVNHRHGFRWLQIKC